MNYQLSFVFAVSLILIGIGSCASYDVLDRSVRDTLKQQLDDCNSQVDKTKDVIQSMIQSLKELHEGLTGVNGVGSTRKIAFHAILTHVTTLGQLQAVVFDQVITNNGNGYNSYTGHFTAAREGTYYFTTSFLSHGGKVHLQMMRNAEVIGTSAGFPDAGSSGSISATVNLKRGDLVKIRHMKGEHSQQINAPYTMFTGFLL